MTDCDDLQYEVELWRRWFKAQNESRLFGGIIYIPASGNPGQGTERGEYEE